ncbi:MAG: hypothetical protein ACI9CD_001266 [Candidatus Deianiraeaceae bacterium]
MIKASLIFKGEMTNIKILTGNNQKLLKKASLMLDSTETPQELSACARVIKLVIEMEEKILSIVEKEREKSNDSQENSLILNTVYDIIILEDILQSAKERFKDDLHLIADHQNDIQTIKMTNKLLTDFHRKHNITSWKSGDKITEGNFFAKHHLPQDAHNLSVFTKQLKHSGNNTALHKDTS